MKVKQGYRHLASELLAVYHGIPNSDIFNEEDASLWRVVNLLANKNHDQYDSRPGWMGL